MGIHQRNSNHSPWDTAGMTLSLLCVVHCAAMPVAIVYLPSLGLQWLSGGMHQWFAVGVTAFCLISFVPGYFRHRRIAVPLLGGLGLLVICAAAVAENDDPCCARSSLRMDTVSDANSGKVSIATCTSGTLLDLGWTPFGSLLLILSHSLNCHWSQCCRCHGSLQLGSTKTTPSQNSFVRFLKLEATGLGHQPRG